MYEDKVGLITSFQLNLNILNLLQCYTNILHLGVVYGLNIPCCHLVSYVFVLNNLLIILLDTSSHLVVAYQHSICARPAGFTVIDE